MGDTLRISGIIDESIVDGKGLRYTIFTQGCPHHCQGCHNPDTHDFEGGTEKEITAIYEEICKNPLLSGVTFSGGDPLHKNNITEITRLAKEIREKFPDKTIWLYTGSLWESIQKEEIVRYLDVCVDGEFIVEQMDTSLKWKGSANQRVIDVKKTLAAGKVVLHTRD